MKPIALLRVLASVAALAGGGLRAADSALVQTEFIYETAPFPQCHASTIVETKGGLVAAWFGGTREKHPDVGIWLSRQVRGRWTPPVEVANGVQFHFTTGQTNRHPCWNPVLFQPARGPLMLFYKAGPNPSQWWGMLMTSADGGKSWDTPRRLPEGILGPVKNKPVQLADGSILAPTSYEDPQTDAWTVHFERTADLGRTWTRTPALNEGKTISAIQPSVLFFGRDHLVAVGRSRQNRIFEIESTDGGRTWGPMRLGTLPNPNSGTDALTLKDGRHLIVYNHVPGEPGKWGGKRSPLNVAVSTDGRTWQAALVLEDEPGREFSYPAVIQSKDGLVHVTYTWQRRRVKHAVIDPARLSLRPMVDGQWPR